MQRTSVGAPSVATQQMEVAAAAPHQSPLPSVAGQLGAMLAPSPPPPRQAPVPERAPDVSIVIHRLEVRAPAEPQRPARARAADRTLSLDAYLKSRSRP